MSVQGKAWKIGAVVAALVCTGALAATVGVTIHRYHFEGQGADGNYNFTTEPEIIYQATSQDANGAQSGIAVGGRGGATMSSQGRTVEQAQRDLEEIDEVWRLHRLQQGTFLGYDDRIVHGRLFTFETDVYTFADGTVVTHSTGDPKGHKTDLSSRDWDELRGLKGEDLGTEERTVQGRVFSFQKLRYILRDGSEVIQSTGKPKENP